MATVNRGNFLRTASAAGTAWQLSPGTPGGYLPARPAEARIDVLLNEPVDTIASEIYGHFLEHPDGDQSVARRTVSPGPATRMTLMFG